MEFVANPNGHCRLCTKKDRAMVEMITCDDCDRWFHLSCVNLDKRPPRPEDWYCVKCQQRNKEYAAMTKDLEMKNMALQAEASTSNGAIFELMRIHERTMSSLVTSFQNKNLSDDSMSENSSDWTVYLKRQALVALPKFSGNAREWPKFKKIFEETTKEGQFNNLENLSRLQTVLEGKAARCVQQLMLDPENINEIMNRLGEVFGSPKIVFEELVHELNKAKRDVVEISDALENLVNNMTMLDAKGYLYDNRLIDDTVKKLPFNLQIKWVETLQSNAEKNRIPTVVDLCNWLRPTAKVYRATSQVKSKTAGDERRIHLHQDSPKKYTEPRRPPQGKCVTCTLDHNLENCESYVNYSSSSQHGEFLISNTGRARWGISRPHRNYFYETGHMADEYKYVDIAE
ncbi:uncharacterized protein LOC131434001 [Malaya genurostris]|uniref:uncharacterized protein LOC131434001 n=1 Tax=Malaya genurostris TaxID=325434 RepID=UPI0026F3F257|nr:uncharacterized protein LOC131434001 [Malaya genurostris]